LIADTPDAAGNVLADPYMGTMTYDGENRLLTFTNGGNLTAYDYDGEGRRVRKTVTGGTSSSTAYVYDAAGQLTAEYSTAADPDAGTRYLTQDHLGSTRLVTTASGTVAQRLDYLPFGAALMGTATEGNRNLVAGYAAVTGLTMEFTGKERDGESGLDFFGARYFSAARGRFTSADPKQFSLRTIANPQKWNKYAYVLNNPLASIDPNGREEIKLTVTAYIPDRSFRFPPAVGPTFRGDGRGTDPNSDRFRVRGTVTIETDPSIRSNPVIKYSGTSSGSSVDFYGLKTIPGQANVQISVTGSRDDQGNAVVGVSLSGKDPLTPSLITPAAAANLTFTFTPTGDQASFSGTVTPYPAFEIYATPAGGDPARLGGTTTSQDPILGSPLGLFLGQSQKISGSGQLPVSDDCKKTGTCSGQQDQ